MPREELPAQHVGRHKNQPHVHFDAPVPLDDSMRGLFRGLPFRRGQQVIHLALELDGLRGGDRARPCRANNLRAQSSAVPVTKLAVGGTHPRHLIATSRQLRPPHIGQRGSLASNALIP